MVDQLAVEVVAAEMIVAVAGEHLHDVAFEVDDLHATVEQLAADGYGLIGGIGRYEDVWLMAYVRGPEGIIVALAERIG